MKMKQETFRKMLIGLDVVFEPDEIFFKYVPKEAIEALKSLAHQKAKISEVNSYPRNLTFENIVPCFQEATFTIKFESGSVAVNIIGAVLKVV